MAVGRFFDPEVDSTFSRDGKFFDPVTNKFYTAAKLTELRNQRANNALQEEREEKQEQSIPQGDPLRVRPLSKGASRSFIGGGATTYPAEVNPTDFVPSSIEDPDQRLPDYYRNGRQIQRQITQEDGTVRTVSAYAPLPSMMDSISDTYPGMLSSIRLIDPKQIKQQGPSSGNPRQGQLVPEFSKFFLENVQESHNEKFQLVETFNDFYVYFYGEKPPIYTFSGHLLNLLNYNWKNEFMYFYENFWRGTKAVELGARVFLTYDYQQIQGYLLAVNTNVQSLTDKAASFSIQVLVTKRLFFNGPEQGDGIVRDNLIPRTEGGLVNTEADAFSRALTAEFLNGSKNAAEENLATAENADRGARILREGQKNVDPQELANPSNNPLSSLERGRQKAISVVRGIF